MLSLFRGDRKPDIKTIRSSLLQFIKEQLQKADGGEARNMRGIFLYLTCPPQEKHLFEAAVYADDKDRFKNDEIQKIADDYAIDLPLNWTLEIIFDEAPGEAIKAKNVDAALIISTRNKPALQKEAIAYLKVLNGSAEKPEYLLKPVKGKITIGREKKVQAADGFFRENVIAFPAASEHESNKSVSRQHAHIEWDTQTGTYCLYADEGGIPPRNKTKVRDSTGEIVKIQTSEIGHTLREGDQVMLGESAVLAFSYKAGENT